MSTLLELIKSAKATPIIRLYMKRRNYDTGNYETSWIRIDKWNGVNIVESFGSTEYGINSEPGRISDFSIEAMSLEFDNTKGLWNYESDPLSLFYGFLNRKFTKIRVDAGYLDEDGTEIGVSTIFEGLVDSVKTDLSQKAKVKVLSYLSILTRYDISDLALSGSKTVSQIVDLIMNQSKITQFIPFVSATPTNNITVLDCTLITGNYWEVIKKLAYHSASVPLLIATTWSFCPRESSGGSVWDFKGIGNRGSLVDIEDVEEFDDEGADRVRCYFVDSTGTYKAICQNPILSRKYLGEPEKVDLSFYNSTNIQASLNGLLAYWQYPRQRIVFTTRFLVNQIKPLNKITIRILGPVEPINAGRFDDGSTFDDGILGEISGAVNIWGTEWIVTKVSKDLDSWKFKITAERVLLT